MQRFNNNYANSYLERLEIREHMNPGVGIGIGIGNET